MLVQEGDCTQGMPIKSGTPIRLQHMNTRRWLHSHKFPSPLSGNQEVRASGRTPLLMATVVVSCGSASLSGVRLFRTCHCRQRRPLDYAKQQLNAAQSHKWDSGICMLLSCDTCNGQVSAFGDDQVSDHLDVWEVSFTGGQWMRDQKVCYSTLTSHNALINPP